MSFASLEMALVVQLASTRSNHFYHTSSGQNRIVGKTAFFCFLKKRTLAETHHSKT